jgi:tRNA(Ile)-lysidine synthase
MTSIVEHPLETAITRAWPTQSWRDLHVVLAVSGGPDSVALLRAVTSLKQRFGGSGRVFVAHVNHGLRAAAADGDQVWLEDLCRRLETPIEVVTVNVVAAAAEQGDGFESAARQARYSFLCATAERLGARWVAVGHTADDQVETVLHRILRGTGMAGLGGMPRIRPLSPIVTLVRPLIDLRRRDVLQYLADIEQEFRTDASNAESCFTRNRLRNELLPAIRTHINPDVDQALIRLAAMADETKQLITASAESLNARCVVAGSEPLPQALRIDCRVLADEPLLLVRESCKLAWQRAGWPLQSMGFQEWQQLAAMVCGDHNGSAINLPGDIHARRDGDSLILERRPRAV